MLRTTDGGWYCVMACVKFVWRTARTACAQRVTIGNLLSGPLIFLVMATILSRRLSAEAVPSPMGTPSSPDDWNSVDGNGMAITKTAIEQSLQTVHEIATESLGKLCISTRFRPLNVAVGTERYEGARQKADLAAAVLQEVGVNRHGGLLDALAKGLLSDNHITGARILAINVTTRQLVTSVWWTKQIGGLAGPHRVEEDGVLVGAIPDPNYPWFEDEASSPGLRSPKFTLSPLNASYRGWWTFPYYSCSLRRWMLSYSVAIPSISRHGIRGFLSIDLDVSDLQVNQCNADAAIEEGSTKSFASSEENGLRQIRAFHGSHKCHSLNMECKYRANGGAFNKNPTAIPTWTRGAYNCFCRQGFYSGRHPNGFNGTIMEVAYQDFRQNVSDFYEDVFKCVQCEPGCIVCTGPEPCLATYNWPFRISLLTISIMCAGFTVALAGYMYHHRKIKVFKVASPIFLTITLLGCTTMYLEMSAIFPILDTYSCIATKWTRHMGFCITYTALLMKTWRVSLTYRVKSAHKVKLTDKQLLQWMVPILLVMLIYLSTWTLSATPTAEEITDHEGLKFNQCSYNWWDHSLAIGEVLFLAWGIRVCYNVRNAESLYNEARSISFAIYNIAFVNTLMVAIHLFIAPEAGPDMKYLLGFVRTQLSTTLTICLVFGPKVLRVLRGQGDQWDNKARARGITASFSLNGMGLVADDAPDLYQENEELKTEIQKLAAQIEFMKIVNMEMNNRHLKPKPGGYFTMNVAQSPVFKGSITGPLSQSIKHQPSSMVTGTGTGTGTGTSTAKGIGTSPLPAQSATTIIGEDGHSGTHSIGNNSICSNKYPTTSGNTERV